MKKRAVIFFMLSFLCSSLQAQPPIPEGCPEFASGFNAALGALGPFPTNQSELPKFEKKGPKWVLNTEGLSEARITLLRSAISWVVKLRLQHPDFARCVFDRAGEDVMEWWTYINSNYTGNTELPSPNFYKATYLSLNVRPLGVIRPFIEGEGYSSSYDLLIGRTVKRSDPGKDRNLRINVGAKYLHQYENDEFLGLGSVDLKLTDLKIAGLFNIGLLKLQFQGYGNADIVGGEVGLGFETYGFGLQILSVGYQDYFDTRGLYVQSGFIIMPFELKRFFRK